MYITELKVAKFGRVAFTPFGDECLLKSARKCLCRGVRAGDQGGEARLFRNPILINPFTFPVFILSPDFDLVSKI